MSRARGGAAGRRDRLLTVGSGGWLVAASLLLVVAALAWRVGPLLDRAGEAPPGPDHGFDLSRTAVPREAIVDAGVPRDGLPVLDAPPVMPATAVAGVNEAHRGKFLVPGDRVVGVALNDAYRAYPVRVLNWHEIVNDELGGVPIAVAFNPLCDSVAVFDRRVGGEVVEFGFSGLLYNSNLLLYDRRGAGGEPSLWSPLRGRAIAGPAAASGRRLTRIAASLATWGHWTARHPATTVLRPEPDRLKRYQRNPYGSYLARGTPRFPVAPMPRGPVPPMTPVIAVGLGGGADDGFATFAIDPGLSDPASVTAALSRYGLEAAATEDGFSVVATDRDAPPVVFARWFAWHAQHPDTRLTVP